MYMDITPVPTSQIPHIITLASVPLFVLERPPTLSVFTVIRFTLVLSLLPVTASQSGYPWVCLSCAQNARVCLAQGGLTSCTHMRWCRIGNTYLSCTSALRHQLRLQCADLVAAQANSFPSGPTLISINADREGRSHLQLGLLLYSADYRLLAFPFRLTNHTFSAWPSRFLRQTEPRFPSLSFHPTPRPRIPNPSSPQQQQQQQALRQAPTTAS
ncbi:hypothetical protein GE09DRAFT_92847 [Coniochaeta sp. 2T2.1]|nr:hypothetical protein GE09DRAFT_92847 [Coniochaeta sp. 2T2.1]